jgi:hypothetical protein
MRGRQFASVGLLLSCAVGGTLVGAQQPGVGQTPSSLPLTAPIRERGSSVTPAFEGWYFDKDGSQRVMVGYFNRNTKQEFDIPAGPNNRIEPGLPDQGQPTHFSPGRQWGVFTIKLPKDFGTRKLSWTIVANGFTNTITLHTNADYIVEPFEDAANKNTPPKLKFQPSGSIFTGPPQTIAEKFTGTVGVPVPLTVWISDEGPKINIPEPRGRGRGAAGRGAEAAAGATGATGAGGATGTAAGRGAARGAAPEGFTPPPPMAVTWTKFRGPGDVTFDNNKPTIDRAADGKTVTTATFSAPGDYVLRVEGNDNTGSGGGGFQCCWTNAHVSVTVKAAPGTGGER